MKYKERAARLRETKIQQTLAKKAQQGYIDCDDNGGIPLADDFKFSPVSNSPNGLFHGATGFSVNLAKFLDAVPVYVDPLEALAGRHTIMLLETIGISWPGVWPDFIASYDHLKANQEKYNIICGIGSNQHLAPDYNIGAELGFPGFIKIIDKYRAINDESRHEFYDAEKRVVRAIIRYIERHLDEISHQLEMEKDPDLIRSLKEMYECNYNLTQREPRTFFGNVSVDRLVPKRIMDIQSRRRRHATGSVSLSVL